MPLRVVEVGEGGDSDIEGGVGGEGEAATGGL